MLSLHTVAAGCFRAPTPCEKACSQELTMSCRSCDVGGPLKTAEQRNNWYACRQPFLDVYHKCMEVCMVQQKEKREREALKSF